MRHAVAHPEHYRNQKEMVATTDDVDIPGLVTVKGCSQATIGVRSTDGRFYKTYDGILVGYTLDEYTYRFILDIVQKIFRQFEVFENY